MWLPAEDSSFFVRLLRASKKGEIRRHGSSYSRRKFFFQTHKDRTEKGYARPVLNRLGQGWNEQMKGHQWLREEQIEGIL